MSMIADSIVDWRTVRKVRDAEKALAKAKDLFRAEALANMPLIDGKRIAIGSVVELASGRQYQINNIWPEMYSSGKTMNFHLVARKRNKGGRRPGHLAMARTSINFSEVCHVVV
jgi:hypothetical protein